MKETVAPMPVKYDDFLSPCRRHRRDEREKIMAALVLLTTYFLFPLKELRNKFKIKLERILLILVYYFYKNSEKYEETGIQQLHMA